MSDDPRLGGGPDEEIYDQDPSVFIPSFMWETDPEKTEPGTMMQPTEGMQRIKFQTHKQILETKGLDVDNLIEMSSTQLKTWMGPLPAETSRFRGARVAAGRHHLDNWFHKYSIRVFKNKKITLKSNSVLQNVGRKYRWTFSGIGRTRKRPKYKRAYWSWAPLTKEQVTIHTPNDGKVNGLIFTGNNKEADELVFTINEEGCILDILLEIELETGQRFTEKIFIPRAIRSYTGTAHGI